VLLNSLIIIRIIIIEWTEWGMFHTWKIFCPKSIS